VGGFIGHGNDGKHGIAGSGIGDVQYSLLLLPGSGPETHKEGVARPVARTRILKPEHHCKHADAVGVGEVGEADTEEGAAEDE
jgi:hypothetical protein